MPELEERYLKFVTEGTAELASHTAVDAVLKGKIGQMMFTHKDFCMVIVVPKMKVVPGAEFPLNKVLEPHVLFEYCSTNPNEWQAPYGDIARSKALQLWQGRNYGFGTNPHMLFPGDTPYSGGVYRDLIAVAGSGLPSVVDRALSEMTLSLLIAIAALKWEISSEKEQRLRFVS